MLITVRQGVALRAAMQSSSVSSSSSAPALDALPGGRLAAMQQALAADVALVEEDRMLEPDLRRLLTQITGRKWNLYDA